MTPRRTAAFVLVVALISPAKADTILVPDDYATIQAAIDASSDGDVIEVSLWSTREAINLRGKAIHVRGARYSVRIDATGLESSVVTCASGEGPDTVLENLILIGGSADRGGGAFVLNSSPTLIMCRFTENSATSGGGMYNENSNPSLTYCSFSGNTADQDGGGMCNVRSAPTMNGGGFYGNSSRRGGAICNISSTLTATSIQIRSNSAEFGGGIMNQDSDGTLTFCGIGANRAMFSGGGIYNEKSSPTVTALFIGNSARFSGGAMFNGIGSHAQVTSCELIGNSAGVDTLAAGAAIFNTESSPRITNCSFTGNSTRGWGAGLFNDAGSNPIVVGCSFFAGIAARGGAVYNVASAPVLTQCTFVAHSQVQRGSVMFSEQGSRPAVFNSILWGNDLDQIVDQDAHTTIEHSAVEGGYDGPGNIDADPLFVRTPDPGEDGEWGTYDDDYGDTRLQAESPCIDAADNGALPLDVTDIDRDGDTEEPLPFDRERKRRLVDAPEREDTGKGACPIVDMGMYEFQAEGGCCLRDPRWRCDGDVDGDGQVNPVDSGLVQGAFGSADEQDLCSYDVDCNGQINPVDSGIVQSLFGVCEDPRVACP